MTREEKIQSLIQTEWDDFQKVQNEGGRASCQDDRETFFIMRRTQFSQWPEELLDSYAEDLERAHEAGRNLLTEKYAWMMESTAPAQFKAIRHLLQQPSLISEQIIEDIVAVQLPWMKEYRQMYPALAAGNRPLSSDEDTPYVTSFETYLRGELHTYSAQTLGCYMRFVSGLKKEGRNLTLQVMEAEVQAYGYKDLRSAEERQARRR